MAAGAVEAGSPWAPVNAVAPLLLTPEAAERREWDPVATPVGLAIMAGGITGWTVLHRALLRRLPPRAAAASGAAWAAGAASAAALALFDYRILPPARRPRFRRWLSLPATAAKYAVFAAVLGLLDSRR